MAVLVRSCLVAVLQVGAVLGLSQDSRQVPGSRSATSLLASAGGVAASGSAKAPNSTVVETGSMSAAGLAEALAQHSFHDGEHVPHTYLLRNAELALRARNEIGVAAHVPQDMFMEYVLPYRQLDEPIDDWRAGFFEVLKPYAAGAASLHEAAAAVYPKIWTELRRSEQVMGGSASSEPVVFKANCTPQVMAPVSETLKVGHASCTGCSILVADALRAVGVPARVVGTPSWNTKEGGNHNWVEVWTGEGDGDGWHFFDAVPQDKVDFDKAWFVPGNVKVAEKGTAHGIYAPVWDSSGDAEYSLSWRDTGAKLPAVDRTDFYLLMAGEQR